MTNLQFETEIYRCLFQTTTASVLVVEKNTLRIVEANDAACKLYDYSRRELLDLLKTDISAEPNKSAWSIEHEDKSVQMRIHRRKNGETFPVEIAGGYFTMNSNVYLTAIVNDISKRLRLEEEREELRAQMYNLQKIDALGQLAGGIAHDFNNLLGGIFGYIDMATEETAEHKRSTYLEKAMKTINRARSLTCQLLTFARGGEPIRTIQALEPIIRETIEFSMHGSRLIPHFIFDPELWHCSIDKNQISQVIENIVLNARDAANGNRIIEVMAHNVVQKQDSLTLSSGNYVQISIRDFGTGIPTEVLNRIFDPFYTTKPKGNGLGLSASFSIVRRHGGSIDVESVEGKGSCFHVYLPAETGIGTMNDEKEYTMISDLEHTGSGTFLIMDDEEIFRGALTKMLESFGYRVMCSDDGESTVKLCQAENESGRKFVAAIFDLTVPGGLGGKEIVAKIRSIYPSLPLFATSGYAVDPIIAKPLDFGFTGSLCKPFTKKELSLLLQKHLGNQC